MGQVGSLRGRTKTQIEGRGGQNINVVYTLHISICWSGGGGEDKIRVHKLRGLEAKPVNFDCSLYVPSKFFVRMWSESDL